MLMFIEMEEYQDEKKLGIFLQNKGFTGKFLSEALIFASTNPQYDDRLFIKLQVQYMKIPSSNHVLPIVLQKEELLTKIYLYKW